MRGRGPGELTAAKVDPTSGATILTRPLCIYPAYPRYKGRGDPNKASSFTCTSD
jgi:feruloyl esterase